MIGSVTLDLPAGPAIGRTHQVIVIHVSNKLANLNLSAAKQKSRNHLDWQAQLIQQYHVQVVMGDYNMALFHAVQYFRSRGMVVDVGAWYPWKSINIGPTQGQTVWESYVLQLWDLVRRHALSLQAPFRAPRARLQ